MLKISTMTLLNEKILNEKIYKDINELVKNDTKIVPDILLTNYLYFISFFASEKITLKVGGDIPSNSNLFSFVVGHSGCGKSYGNKLIYDIIFDLQTKALQESNEHKSFVYSCIGYEKENDKLTNENKENFVTGYNIKHNTSFNYFTTKPIKEHIFCSSDFTAEGLTSYFSTSKNNTILCNFDEFEDIKNNMSRTTTVSNVFTFFTPFFDGKNENIIRKGAESITMKNAKICMLANTVFDTFDSLISQGDFINSGLGYRYLFLITERNNELKDPDFIKKAENNVSYFKVFQDKLRIVFNDLYNMIYNCNTLEPIVLTINRDDNLRTYNELLSKLWINHIKNNNNLNTSQKNTIKNRLSTMFNKCIINTYMLNNTYDTSIYPFFNSTELSKNDIIRGYYVYDFYLSQLKPIFEAKTKSNLTTSELEALNLLKIGQPLEKQLYINKIAENNIMSKAGVYRFLAKKDLQFTIKKTDFGKKEFIIRNY